MNQQSMHYKLPSLLYVCSAVGHTCVTLYVRIVQYYCDKHQINDFVLNSTTGFV